MWSPRTLIEMNENAARVQRYRRFLRKLKHRRPIQAGNYVTVYPGHEKGRGVPPGGWSPPERTQVRLLDPITRDMWWKMGGGNWGYSDPSAVRVDVGGTVRLVFISQLVRWRPENRRLKVSRDRNQKGRRSCGVT